jgi:hypothetical protein
MRIGGIVGGAALVGVAVLIGIALNDDSAPEIITSDTSPFVFNTTPTTSVPGVAPTTAAASTSTAATTPATTDAPPTTTTLIPPEQRAGIAVRVLNGGAEADAATYVSDVLRNVGFAPAGAADAESNVEATRVIFAPGRDLDAATVNDVVRARPENVVPAGADDRNWEVFGDGLAVLVVLGPAGT